MLVGRWRRPGVVSWQSAPVLVSAGCARCGGAVSWLCVQAVYILGLASRMSTHCDMLPSYVGLCWFNFSMFQHATHTTVVLDTAWPWASEAYGLCAVCAHTFVRINLYVQDHTALSFCRSLLQACLKLISGAGYCLALGQ